MVVKELVAELGLEINETGFEKAEAALHALHHGVLAFGAAAIGALAVGAAALAKSTADAAASAGRLAQATGLDLETVQQLGFAGEASGVSMETLAHSLQHLAKTGVKDIRAGVLDLSEKFHGMPDSASARAEKVRLAIQKFGRAGAAMVPFLNKGKEAISELMEEATELGLVFSEEDVAAGKEFKHELHLIEGAFQGLAYTIGRVVLPFFTRLLVGFNNLIKFVRANWTPVLNNVILGLRVLAFVLGGVVLTALIANAAAIASTIGWYVALGFAAAVAGVKAAAAWLLAAAPVAALVALFAILGLAIEDVYTFFKGGDSLLGELGPKWTKFLDGISRPRAGDPWWLAALREALKIVTDLEGELPKLWDRLAGALGGNRTGQQAFGDAFVGYAKNGQPPAFSGGGAMGPSAAAAGAPAGVHVNAPQFKVDLQIFPAPGQSAQEIADVVTQKMDAHFDAKVRGAASGLAP